MKTDTEKSLKDAEENVSKGFIRIFVFMTVFVYVVVALETVS